MELKIDPKILAIAKARARSEFASSGGKAILKKRGPDYFRQLAKKGNKAKRAKRAAKLAVDKSKKKP